LIYADFHIHTTFSSDSVIGPKILVQRLVEDPLVKVAAVTDHSTIDGVRIVQKLAEPYPDLLIIPGVEVTTLQGDVLILGVEKLPPHPWTAENVIAFAKRSNAVSVAVHPYRELGLGDYTQQTHVDAVEVINGGSSNAANKLAHELAKCMKLPGVGGSDSHRPEDLFSVYNEVHARLNIDEILRAIKKGLVNPLSAEKSIHF
jgi:predicted metal-dependent phosphoesterase TrpH